MGIKLSTIFELLKNYDTYGFDLLYENYFRLMYGVAFSISKDDEVSKDAIQNTMICLYKLDASKFPSNNELSWLYKVVKNETLQLLRKEKIKINIDDIDDIPSLDKSIETIINMDSYYYLIQNLNETQRKIVTLKVVSGLKHNEISTMLDMPLGTVLWNYNTSIKKLRLSLSGLATIFIAMFALAINNNSSRVEPLMAVNNSSVMELKSIIHTNSFDYSIIIYLVMFLSFISFIYIYFKSDKFSLKTLSKK